MHYETLKNMNMETRNIPRNRYSCQSNSQYNRYVNIDIKLLYEMYTAIHIPNFMTISQYLDPDNIRHVNLKIAIFQKLK
jgi:hypothetical protein